MRSRFNVGLMAIAAAEVLAFTLVAFSPSDPMVVTGGVAALSTLIGFGIATVMAFEPERPRRQGRTAVRR